MREFLENAGSIWSSGGWLMIPMFALAVIIYYVGLELFFHLHFHFLVRSRVCDWSNKQIVERVSDKWRILWELLDITASTNTEVRRHFEEVRDEYLMPVNRRIRYLGVLVAVGPSVGLLGTVTGMLTTFNGMVRSEGSRMENVIAGISEALITTQTGLIISIPGLVLLTLIIQKRNVLQRSILRLERYNAYWMMHVEWLFPEDDDPAPAADMQA